MSIYDTYAQLYDGVGQIRFSLLMHPYLNNILEQHPVQGKRAIDIACGTGTLALLLADDGWQVTGFDASPAMLAQAREKCQRYIDSGSIDLVECDMRSIPAAASGSFQAGSKDLAICVYDSLNYLLSAEELGACFAGIAWSLAPNGLFVGDMNTRHFLEFDWGEYEVQEHPGYVQISQSYFDPNRETSTLVLTGFLGNDEQGYDRFDEVHIERAYPTEEVKGLLEQAGLVVEAIYDSFTLQAPSARSQRLVWVARKA